MATEGRQRLRDLSQPWRNPLLLVLTGLGSGLSPRAPGTFGSLAALVIWWFVLAALPGWVQLLVCLGVFGLGTWLANVAARRYGLGDDPAIVIDEFVGQWLALLAAPATPMVALAGFALFRLFDIWKPWPVRLADQRVGGGLGVMLDDVLAGVMAWGVLVLVGLIRLV